MKYILEIDGEIKMGDNCYQCEYGSNHTCPRSGQSEVTCILDRKDKTYANIPDDCPLRKLEKYEYVSMISMMEAHEKYMAKKTKECEG